MSTDHADEDGTRRGRLEAAPRMLGTYGAAGACVGAVLSVLDCLTRGPSGGLALHALGLGAAAGAITGIVTGLVLFLVGLMSSRALRIVIVTVGAAGFCALAIHQLGVLERLSGPYALLAWLALFANLALAGLGALGTLAFAPDPSRASSHDAGALFGSFVGHRSRRVRSVVALVLMLVCVCCIVADATLFVGQYAFIHEVLRRTARISALVALPCAMLPVRWLVVCTALLTPASLVALITLDESRETDLAALRTAPFVALPLDDLRALADVDVDGFPAWLGGGDCAPFDPTIHPNAQEIPANGIDDNCRLGDLASVPASKLPTLRAPNSASQAPSIVLITIDSLRADHLSAYGYPRKTSPNLDAWFAGGLRCNDAIAAGAFTTVSVPSLLRGVSPRRLRWSVGRQTDQFRLFPAGVAPDLRPDESWFRMHLLALDAGSPTLAEMLGAVGYQTWAVVDDGGWAFLSKPLVGQGFSRFEYVPEVSEQLWDPRGDEQVARRALEVLASRDARPFFLWIHFIGVHAPDATHASIPSFGESHEARYDHEIAKVDHELRAVLEALTQIERERPLVTVLTSDHGEEFYPQGRSHGSSLAEDEIRVPLLLRGTGIPHGTIDEVVSLVDIAPTLLVAAGVSDGTGFDGVNLLSARERASRTAVRTDVWRYSAAGELEIDRVAAVSKQGRLVFDAMVNSRQLFTRGTKPTLRGDVDPALAQNIAEYLEITGPRPLQLSP